MRTCEVEGCDRTVQARGLCRPHYYRYWSSADYERLQSPHVQGTKEMKFWAKVDKRGSDECWEWTASRGPKGYGKANYQGEWYSPHRFSYELHVGPIPDGLTIDHLCRNKGCVNPAHLEAVTNLENRRRAAALQTHCRKGHEFTPENTARHSVTNARVCRECQRTAGREWARRHYIKRT